MAKTENHGTRDKEVVMGMIERNGKAYLKHIPNTCTYTLLDQIKEHVDPTATIMTDQLPTYLRLPKMGYEHYYVNHQRTYVTHGTIHTQNAENMWSNMRRGIYGVYSKVSKNICKRALTNMHSYITIEKIL